MIAPLADRETADRLRDEIALLAAVKAANERAGSTFNDAHREVLSADAEGFWWDAVQAGISEWDADHPCRAIDEREAELRLLCPDLELRAMGAATLPGLEAYA